MGWFNRDRAPKGGGTGKKSKLPDGLWSKCNNCNEIIYNKELERNLYVCPKCSYHFRISAQKRISLTFDENSFIEYDATIYSPDPLKFKDVKKYKDRLKENQKITGMKDAIVTGESKINGIIVMTGIFDFSFMGGSMGVVVGEKITRIIESAIEKKYPLIIFTSSGGARMQEGIYSLMQMAKTTAALERFKRIDLPYISILTDPTTGGVTASFAMLGDIIIAEPKAIIGFAGPRVIEQTIKQKLPEGFQRAEYLLEHGMVDFIVERKDIKEKLSKLLSMLI